MEPFIVLILLKKVKKQIKGVLTEIVLGSNTRFTFVPQSAYGEKDKTKGLIIDNRDLNYFLVPTLEDVVSCQVDSQNIRLTEEKREYYNKIFCLSDGQGFALVDTEITSPWIEYEKCHRVYRGKGDYKTSHDLPALLHITNGLYIFDKTAPLH